MHLHIFFCTSCCNTSMIAFAWTASSFLSAALMRSSRCCQQRAGASFASHRISLSVTIIFEHIEPYVKVRGLGRFILWQLQNILQGSGIPCLCIQRQTLWRSHRRESHIPVAGLHLMYPIMNLLILFSEWSIYCLNLSSQ
jgi:hypothetical protein